MAEIVEGAEVTEKVIRQFEPLSKVPSGEFPALMGGDQAVAEVIDSSTGRPVLVGQVQSSKVIGSTVWSPLENEGENRVSFGVFDPTVASTTPEPYLLWRAAGQSNDDDGYRLAVGPYTGYGTIAIWAVESTNENEGMLYIAPAATTCQWGFRYDGTNQGLFEFDGTDFLLPGGKVTSSWYPPPPAGGGKQSSAPIYGGIGAPDNAEGNDGGFYFRSDGGAGTRIYHKAAGAWTAFA